MNFELVELEGDAFAFQNKQDNKVIAEITWTMLGRCNGVRSHIRFS